MQIQSMSSYSGYNQALINQQKAMLRISTAQRINSAADDVASSAISERIKGQSNGLNQASRNMEDSRSLLNTAEGGMDSSADTMQRMRELSVQASNGTLTDEDRSSIQLEMDQLGKQLDSNATGTQYNGISTNDGTLTNFTTQSGANSGETTIMSIGNLSKAALGISGNVSTQAAAFSSIENIDKGIEQLSSARSNVGAMSNGFDHGIQNANQSAYNQEAAYSSIRDADLSKQSILFNQSGTQLYSSIAALSLGMQSQQSTLSTFV